MVKKSEPIDIIELALHQTPSNMNETIYNIQRKNRIYGDSSYDSSYEKQIVS